jgi:PKD repeat protein
MRLAEKWSDARRPPAWSALVRLMRSCVLAVIGGCLLALLLTARQATQGTLPAALACGLGNPQTMLANKIPALFYPVTPNMPQNAPQGVFPLDYAANTSIAFIEDLSRVPGAPKISSFRWRWNFGDGTGDVLTESPTHTFTKPGTYYVGSWIWDTTANNWTSFDSAQIHIVASIPANPPVAKVSSNKAYVDLTGTVTFDAAGSRSTDGSQLKYFWNFNDSTTGTGAHIVHQFPLNGTTFVALIVTDARGAQSMATVNITIQTHSPTASLSASDLEIDAGSVVNFDGSQSLPPAGVSGEAITKYVWDFGDGSAPLTTQTPTTSHRYTRSGLYTVSLTVFDKRSEQATTALHVKVLGAATGGAGVSPLVIIGGIVLLAGLGIGLYALWQQRRRARMVREYQEAQAQARARRSQRAPRAPGSGNPGGYGNYGSSGNGRQPSRYDRVPSGQTSTQRRPSPPNGSSDTSPGRRAQRPDQPANRGDW